VAVEPGDTVKQWDTVVAQMLPANPVALDQRSREQARSAVAVAEASLRLARTELKRTAAERELANSQLQRVQQLRQNNSVSETELERAIRDVQTTQAAFESAEATIQVRQAELHGAHIQLTVFANQQTTTSEHTTHIPILSPSSGKVLRLIQQSETTLPAGTAIMEIGNVDDDLEVLVELLSTDAVQVSPSARALIEKWGGRGALDAVVERIEPWGFTKFSALGVEEQRVNTILRFINPPPAGLGHGFRVEARIITWENEKTLIVPSSALFRSGDHWSVFLAENSIAKQRNINVGHNNGVQAEVLDGLSVGDKVILYPASDLDDGMRISQRQID
jgi:HlyD family secretion protein